MKNYQDTNLCFFNMFLITFEKNIKKNRPNVETRKIASNINFNFVKIQVEFRNH